MLYRHYSSGPDGRQATNLGVAAWNLSLQKRLQLGDGPASPVVRVLGMHAPTGGLYSRYKRRSIMMLERFSQEDCLHHNPDYRRTPELLLYSRWVF